ncbi:MAG: hypothetical protein SPF09_03125, partial [Bacteroidaceae bacterium]|nr:hypothetical protein [Bacteroidaceae bacterium]
SFHAIIPSFHGMISSFHAVFGLRQRDKSAKVIDYNDQVIRVREYLLFRGIPSPMYFQLSLLTRTRACRLRGLKKQRGSLWGLPLS